MKRTVKLETINIDGYDYTKVSERVKFLADNHQYSIITDAEFIVELNSWKVKATLTIQENDDVFTYTGHALEKIDSNDINVTSALENAETSAVGRACAFAGIGLTENVASADEVIKAKEGLKTRKNEIRRDSAKNAENKALKILKEKGNEK